MKKQVMKLLRMAKKDGDAVARDVLDCIKKSNMMGELMKYDGNCCGWTYFKWGILDVHYNGYTEQIRVYYGNHTWTLCE